MTKPQVHPALLSSEAKIDDAIRVARQELTPEHVAVLRGLGEGVRLHQAFGPWRMAREALSRQAMERGLSYEDAVNGRPTVDRSYARGRATNAEHGR